LLFCSEAWVRIRHTSGMTSIKSLSTNTFASPAKDTTTPSEEVGLVCSRCSEYSITIHSGKTVSKEPGSANLEKLGRLGVYRSDLIVLEKGKVLENLLAENRKRSLCKGREMRGENCGWVEKLE